MPPPLRYPLLALDLDGTLLSPDGTVSAANAAALHAFRAAGGRVLPCTGRGLIECRHILRAIGHETGEAVVAGGSVTADVRTGATVHRFAMRAGLVRHAVDEIHAAGFPALVLKDPAAAGFDYLVVRSERGHDLDPVTEWWFSELGVTARFARTLDDDHHPEQTVRVGLCAEAAACEPVGQRLRQRLAGEAVFHHFGAVVGPEHVGGQAPRRVHILEVFDPRAGKWSAIEEHCARTGTDPAGVVAIGDEVNDLDMIRGAGLGVAMGNAIGAVKALATRHTRSNREDGVAYAIEQVLRGAW